MQISTSDQSFRPHRPGRIESPRDRLTTFARNGIDFTTHFSETDQRDSHVNSLRTSLS